MSFSKEFRQNIVEKVLSGSDVLSVAQEQGVSKYSIYQWVRDHQKGAKTLSGPSFLSLKEKQTLLLESKSILESDMGEWLRKNGIHGDHLEKWKKEIDQAMDNTNNDKVKIKKLESRISELENDVKRKDRALAEVTALLALKKS